MDEEIVRKYRQMQDSVEYSEVYGSQGRDDPFKDMDFIYAQELSGEKAMFQIGEVTMEFVMEEQLEKILDDYSGDDEKPDGLSVYGGKQPAGKGGYEAAPRGILAEEDEEEEEREEEED